jgi:hypothetical protein
VTKENFANVSNEDDIKWKMTSNGRLPQISKVEYLSNDWSDLPKIYTCMTKAKFTNVSNEDDFQWKRTSDGILPQISKMKYL